MTGQQKVFLCDKTLDHFCTYNIKARFAIKYGARKKQVFKVPLNKKVIKQKGKTYDILN